MLFTIIHSVKSTNKRKNMNKDILNIKSTLPSLSQSYAPLDIVGNIFGRYFDYKRETLMIEHETEKVKEQAKIILSQIDAKLEESLDSNNKKFTQEMFRLKTIGKTLQKTAKHKSRHFKTIEKLVRMLADPNIDTSVKALIPNMIAMSHASIKEENTLTLQQLSCMNSYDPDQKLLGGV